VIPLRPYQVEGVDAVRARIRAGKRRIVFVLATGGGKTVVASAIVSGAVAKGKRVLFLAHRRELIKQTVAKLLRNGLPPASLGVIMAGVGSQLVLGAPDIATLTDDELWTFYARRRPGAPVQVASVDTLRNRDAKPTADLVIVDECHRALAKTYQDLAAHYAAAVLLGLTATPYRADGRGLGTLFEELVVIASPKLLVEQGFLVEPAVWTVAPASMPDLSGVKVKRGDYDERALAAAVDRAALVGDLVEHWQRHAGGRRTIVFAASVAHSQHIVDRFREAGIAAEHVDGATPTAERDTIFARLASGETLVVSNCGVCTEGWDSPPVKCCVMARPTKSTGLYLQMAGRILRPWQGVGAVILDHAGCVTEHGFPTDEREFSLEGRAKKPKHVSGAKTCPECFAVLPAQTRECSCGYQFGDSGGDGRDEPKEQAGTLVQLSPDDLARDRHAKVVADWHKRNARRPPSLPPLKPGWVYKRFVELYGTKPPRGCVAPSLTDEQREALERSADGERRWDGVRFAVASHHPERMGFE
jgi:DNA repair protein RadD